MSDQIIERLKSLEKEQEALVNELKNLEKRFGKNEISEDEYKEKRNVIERSIIVTMDRLAQIRFVLGQRTS